VLEEVVTTKLYQSGKVDNIEEALALGQYIVAKG
jgi:hypothetical protein